MWRRVAGLHLQNVLQVGDAHLCVAALKVTPRSELAQEGCAVGDDDGRPRLRGALVPVSLLRRVLGQNGCPLGLLQGCKLIVPPRVDVLLLGGGPVAGAGLDAPELGVGALKAGLDGQDLVEVVGGLGGAAER